MSNPELLVIAGCNGSGKSSFSKALIPDNIVPFDYDFNFLKFYQSLIPTDFQDEMALDKVRSKRKWMYEVR